MPEPARPPVSTPLLQIFERPGIIELTWGHPDPTLPPVAAMRRARAAALDRYCSDALPCGHPAGPDPLLAWLAERIGRQQGRAPALDEIMTAAGISLGLDQLLTCIAVGGDTALVQSPTDHLPVRIMRDHRLNLVPVPSDQDGLRLDALEQAVSQLRATGVQARALYLVPTFNNPTGRSLAEERRRALVELAAAEGLLII
jgi:2-aminoadipate transaminase